MTTDETGLNEALEQAGIHPVETDLAELILQLGHEKPSHIVGPALHINRSQMREIFRDKCTCRTWATSPRTRRRGPTLPAREVP